ncbi:MAG TPA: hypothetical protein PKA28_14090 [Methylomusa anaerophila]|uniref:Formylmethanofuran dehydrogenase subunit E domain-containing protein n=1 Tax=Methylomusa anaerophila TaxID=1930071 RepID=A0A348AF07_9FIRM|nr:FmdE family protein [Methylomusa anaerophila]BBB89655.1 hypothetical protein MAMMFC1_00288 [Methylomusa anaerophila]HML89569.1 hypothetical protein [Methylomusa anaerophila]
MDKQDKQQGDKCVQFHGHECPGLAIGFKAYEAVREKKYALTALLTMVGDDKG